MRSVIAAFNLVAGLPNPVSGQPVLPEADITFEPPMLEVEGFDHVDYRVDSINLARLRGVPVFSSQNQKRIGHVDDLYIDSVTGATMLGLEIGGMLDIGDREVVLPLTQASVFQSVFYPADPYGDLRPGASPTGASAVFDEADLDPQMRQLLKDYAYRFVRYRIYVDATKEDFDKIPEFDLYEGISN